MVFIYSLLWRYQVPVSKFLPGVLEALEELYRGFVKPLKQHFFNSPLDPPRAFDSIIITFCCSEDCLFLGSSAWLLPSCQLGATTGKHSANVRLSLFSLPKKLSLAEALTAVPRHRENPPKKKKIQPLFISVVCYCLITSYICISVPTTHTWLPQFHRTTSIKKLLFLFKAIMCLAFLFFVKSP